MEIFSLTRFWPIYSASVLGRTLASRRASSSYGAPETMRCGGWRSCIMRFVLASDIAPLFLTSCRDGVEHVQPLRACAGSPSFWFGENLQRDAQQLFEIRNAGFAFAFGDGAFRGAAVVTKIGERGDDVGFDSGRRRDGGPLLGDSNGIEFVFQLNDHAFGGFFFKAGTFV